MPEPLLPRRENGKILSPRERIAAERAAAAQLAATTAREVEEMILGHRPAPGG